MVQTAHPPISAIEERIARNIVDAALSVHKTLGPGLLESVYEVCFCHELTKRELTVQRQVVVPIVYDGIVFDEGFRIDVLIDNLIICELKAVEDKHDVHVAQLLTQLKLSGKRLGFLINFNTAVIRHGIRRLIL